MLSKDAGLRIRVEKELRDAFAEACRAEDRHASDVLREFMRAYADQRQGGKQTSLFPPPPPPRRPTAKKTTKHQTRKP